MDAVQQQNLKQFDTTARTWLSTAGFSREHGNALTIGRVVRSEQGFNGLQLQAYGEADLQSSTGLWQGSRREVATGGEDDRHLGAAWHKGPPET